MICVPIVEKNWDKLIEKFKIAQKEADVIEIWFDGIFEINEDFLLKFDLNSKRVEELWKIKEIPILYKVQKTEKFLENLNSSASNLDSEKNLANLRNPNFKEFLKNIDYLDLDFFSILNFQKISNSEKILKHIKNLKNINSNLEIIFSYHNFEITPENEKLEKTVIAMKKFGADIIKLATQANNFSDSLRILKLLNKIKTGSFSKINNSKLPTNKNSQKKILEAICIAMGEKGKITRAAGHLFGNYLMFAPLSEKEKTAPGQYSLPELRKLRNLI